MKKKEEAVVDPVDLAVEAEGVLENSQLIYLKILRISSNSIYSIMTIHLFQIISTIFDYLLFIHLYIKTYHKI